MNSTVSQLPPRNAADALGLMHGALDYFTAADLHALGTEVQGQILLVTNLSGQGERGVGFGASVVRLPGGQQDLAEAVACVGLRPDDGLCFLKLIDAVIQ